MKTYRKDNLLFVIVPDGQEYRGFSQLVKLLEGKAVAVGVSIVVFVDSSPRTVGVTASNISFLHLYMHTDGVTKHLVNNSQIDVEIPPESEFVEFTIHTNL